MALAPDGSKVAVVVPSGFRIIDLDDGQVRTVAAEVSSAAGGLAWLDDDSFVYVAKNRSALERVTDLGAGTTSTIWHSDSLVPDNVTPLPGGRGVLFQACLAPCPTGNLYVLDFKADSARLLLRKARRAVVAGDAMVYFEESGPSATGFGKLIAVRFDQSTMQLLGRPVPVADSVAAPGGQPFFDLSASGTGILMTGAGQAGGESELVWVDQTGRQTPIDPTWHFRVTQFAANYSWSLSPDGRQLAIGLNTEAGDHIWVKQLPRGPLSRVTFDAGPDFRPRWRPDGRWITFIQGTDLAMRRADGTGGDSILWAARNSKTTRLGGGVDEGTLSDDGRWILLRMGALSAANGGRDIYLMRVGEDTVPRPLLASSYDEMAMQLSPNGRSLAYQSNETGRVEIYVRPFPNVSEGKVQVSRDGGNGPIWSRNGRELYYLRGDEMMMAVPVAADGALNLAGQRELFRRTGGLRDVNSTWYTPWDVAADGRFIMTRPIEVAGMRPASLVVIDHWLDEIRDLLHR
jgi:serine/threonine-protein kinase